ncbi:hypothetical protein CIHG_06493 [Coccidioides immitis H538.4]|uniref:Uncharacterized protein n=2 Tax=Coccidioides immitis H538.4 TaxID=396776 RepID=A0A0J8RW65_COCIT|nr:hypothetical protein CIHG_06493 [Coccidioides immitis H538.4]
MGALVRMTEYWSLLPNTKGLNCPVNFEAGDLEEFHKNEEIWFAMNAVVNLWRDKIGVNDDGWVSNEGYADAVKTTKRLKDELLGEMMGGKGDEEDISLLHKGWPFQDHEEVD